MAYYQVYFKETRVCEPSGRSIEFPSTIIARALTDDLSEVFMGKMQTATYKIQYELLDAIELSKEEFDKRKNDQLVYINQKA